VDHRQRNQYPNAKTKDPQQEDDVTEKVEPNHLAKVVVQDLARVEEARPDAERALWVGVMVVLDVNERREGQGPHEVETGEDEQD